MAIFRFAEVFEQLRGEMAKARKAKVDETKVSAYFSRLTAAKVDRPVFERILAELQDDAALTSADLIAIASAYNKGGRKPSSRASALALIKKRFVEIVRFQAKNKVAGEGATLVTEMQSETPKWDIRNEGRAWKKGEILQRFQLKPHKLEIIKGRLLWSKEDRECLLCLLLENVGADRVVQLGDPEVWRSAVAKLAR